jgi:hypothetical protein
MTDGERLDRSEERIEAIEDLLESKVIEMMETIGERVGEMNGLLDRRDQREQREQVNEALLNPMEQDMRLETLEREMREVRVRLGMIMPDTSHLSPEELRKQQLAGIIPIGVAASGKAAGPGEVPEIAPGHERFRQSVANMTKPAMDPEEAVTHYGGASVPMFFNEPVRLIDPDDHRAIVYPKGWSRVPEKHTNQLKGRAERVPESMQHPTHSEATPRST